MGIIPQQAAFIVREHQHRPIEGDILLIGRHSVWLTLDQAYKLLKQEGIEPRPGHLVEYDHSTIGARDIGGKGNWITDRSFFSMFTSGRVIALDVSDYEGAEIIHDLNEELPRELYGVADFIFNGSVLDNLFDPARALRSISKMLRPLGRIIDTEHSTPVNSSFLCYSPEWFFDFFAVNNYADCQIFVCKFDQNSGVDDWQVHWWRPFTQVGPTSFAANTSYPAVGEKLVIGERFVTMCCAEKGAESTDDKTPLQACYRIAQDPHGDVLYIERYQAYIRSRRTFGFSRGLEEPRQEVVPRSFGERIKAALGRNGSVPGRRKFGDMISKHEPVQPDAGTHNQVAAPYVGTLPGSY